MREIEVALLVVALGACADSSAAVERRESAGVLVGRFEAWFDLQQGVVEIRPASSASGLERLVVSRDGTPGVGLPETVELVTERVGEGPSGPCGTSDQFGAVVRLNSFYSGAIRDLAVQIEWQSPVVGYEATNGDPGALGLDPTLGLWRYVSPGTTRTWCFRSAAQGAFVLRGSVWATFGPAHCPDPSLRPGRLFAFGDLCPSRRVAEIDPASGLAACLGEDPGAHFFGLTYDSDARRVLGVALHTGGESRLHEVYPDGSSREIGPTGVTYLTSLQYEPRTGRLFAIKAGSDDLSPPEVFRPALYVLDGDSGAATRIGEVAVDLHFQPVSSLAIGQDCELLTEIEGVLYAVDPISAETHAVAPLDLRVIDSEGSQGRLEGFESDAERDGWFGTAWMEHRGRFVRINRDFVVTPVGGLRGEIDAVVKVPLDVWAPPPEDDDSPD